MTTPDTQPENPYLMNTNAIYQREKWNTLSNSEAKAILTTLIQTQFPRFTLKHFEQFSRFGQHTYTAVLDYEGAEFVFVPGDTVQLGFDAQELPQEYIAQRASEAELTPAAILEYFEEHLSPSRTATIAPMLVERIIRETGYIPVPPEDNRLTDDKYFEEALQAVTDSKSDPYKYILNGTYRLEKNNGQLKAFLYTAASYDELTETVKQSGFRLPTEDEWEYLCGGGSRSLFPWGNSLEQPQRYRHFGSNYPKEHPYYLDAPNQFGITIANDPYHYEVMMDSHFFLKGGDGGCMICGGSGMELGYFTASTYYRDTHIFEEDMEYQYEITGDYTFTRRIIRIL